MLYIHEAMALAEVIAQSRSDDPDTQVGAVIIDARGSLLGVSANELPIGVKVAEERLTKPEKYLYIEHAERGAIYDAARRGNSLEGADMVVTMFPCADCARAIISSGIRLLWTRPLSPERAARKPEVYEASKAMLKEAGVAVHYLEKDET